ncbi:KaiC/GvpD/RAD55 family RecA-like ATPase [Methanohalophilus levihalophilus]|uniref:RAD55 family ATPase n=1 Tax=Methanohalophilus levihalophilus TaxID=1431282 RepID=UPI001FD96B01|nr:recombinase RecA [Methanohalophilus levihalophilus]MBP2029389.1 KaiC/GvpD/RAD55 family RecA-like ATPase [Methanohalophilus levihalophilus]
MSMMPYEGSHEFQYQEPKPVTRQQETKSLYQRIKGNAEPPSILPASTIMPTGIALLDDSLGGGLPSSSLVYFSANPRSMSEVFLYQFSQARKTYYFTTSRRPHYIQRDITNLGFDPSNIIFVDVYSEYYFTATGDMVNNVGNEFADSKIVEFTEYNLNNILLDSKNEEVNIVFDTFSFYTNLNVNLGLIKRLINVLYEATKEVSGITYLYGLKGSIPEQVENEVFNSSDVIFDVTMDCASDKIINKLSIPKIRGMIPSTDVIKFNVARGVSIDTSRDIV